MLCGPLKVQKAWSVDVCSHRCWPPVNLLPPESNLLPTSTPVGSCPPSISMGMATYCAPSNSSSCLPCPSKPLPAFQFLFFCFCFQQVRLTFFLSKYSLSLRFSSLSFSVHLPSLGFHPLPSGLTKATSSGFTGRQLFLLTDSFVSACQRSLPLVARQHSLLP